MPCTSIGSNALQLCDFHVIEMKWVAFNKFRSFDMGHSCLFRYGFHRVESSYLTILDQKKVTGLFKRLRNYPSPNGRTKRTNGDGTVSPKVGIKPLLLSNELFRYVIPPVHSQFDKKVNLLN